MRKTLVVSLFALATIVLLPLAARAQGSIAGSVKDPSGAVLPGVTVEASSDALIEKVRTVVTDSAGNYRIVDLPPGNYVVTFTLTGFKTIRREGILIQGTFSAPVSEQLQVGTLEETITVSGTPTVDVSNNTAQFVVDRDILDQIPTPIRNTPARALLLPGTTVTPFVLGQYSMSVHGSNTADMVIAIDGMRVNNLCGSGQYSGFYMNDAAIEEVTFTTGAESAEMQNGGLRINSTPKDGGNKFSGTFFAYGAGSGLQADNRTDAMKSGPTAIPQPGIAYTWQVNPSIGGPIKRDKLWFYFTYKYEDFKNYVPSSSFADGSRAFRQSQGNYSAVTRLTYQASSKDKIRFYLDRQFNGEDYNGFNTLPTTSPEASTDAYGIGWVPQVKWTQTTTNKLLLEAGLSYYTQFYEQSCRPTVGPRDLPRLEQSTNRLLVACGNTIPPYESWTKSYSGGASASYVTGSHAFKTGVTWQWGTNSRTFSSNAQINTLVTNAGLLGLPASATNPVPCLSLPCPIAVAVSNGPSTLAQKVNRDIGVFAQDTWTLDRLTLNVGGRYDHFNASVPAQSAAAGNWIQARNFPEIPNVPNWSDFSVRLAGAYDVFGTGKTAIKANASQYIAAAAAGFAQTFNPMNYSTQTRAWIDFDGNKSILDAAGNIQFNEVIGGTSNFGQITSRPDPNLRRGYNWEYAVSVQHQLMERVSVTGGYYRRNFYNLDVTDNLNLAVGDWTSFGLTGPTDPRLPRSGERITMYTLNPTKVGVATDNLRTFSGANSSVYNGFELSANMRREKLLLFGGVTTERRATITCDERDNPNSLRFCDSTPPFRTTYKLNAAYQLPYEFQLSGSFIATPGPSVNANYTVTAALAGQAIIGSTAGGTTISVNLAEPNTIFLNYKKQLDLRLGRNFRFGTRRIQAFADIFNVLNAGTVLRVNETYGANPAANAWMTPLTIMDGRYVRFGIQMSF
ncbi:MAG: carboxypeptidase regulatory-like domain-containing protein [Cyanobacteria bacterium]|nr:carboxypeptidase regulatory-like domain-containing protein [Cyanobacteriota bacterium]